MSKIPLTESNAKATPSRQNSIKSKVASPKRAKSIERKQLATTSPSSKNGRLALRHYNGSATTERTREVSVDAKENADLALEINITTGPNVQVCFLNFFFLSHHIRFGIRYDHSGRKLSTRDQFKETISFKFPVYFIRFKFKLKNKRSTVMVTF